MTKPEPSTLNSKPITALHHRTFESVKQVTEDGAEFWFARDLAPLLDYPQWRNFVPVLERAREACHQSGQQVEYHFADIRKMVEIGSGAQRSVDDLPFDVSVAPPANSTRTICSV
jgi:DNA-damage-inducible protein D